MLQAILFGVTASSALVIGGVAGAYWRPPAAVTHILLAFASGALISALAFELFEEAHALGGTARSGLGLLAGAAAFIGANVLLDQRVAKPQDMGDSPARSGSARTLGLALLAGALLDGIPENAALGVMLVENSSVALLVAIFVANVPEAMVGAVAMRAGGRSPRFIVGIWALAALILAAAVVIGRVALGGAGPAALSILLAFAGGAVLAALADTVMPQAFERGRPWYAFATAAGFFLSFLLSSE